MKKKIFLISFIVLSLFTSFSVVKAEDYEKDGYIYSYWGKAIPSAYGMSHIHTYDPYTLGLDQLGIDTKNPDDIYESDWLKYWYDHSFLDEIARLKLDVGIKEANSIFHPQDLFSYNNKLYIVDSKNNALLVLNQYYQLEAYLQLFTDANMEDVYDLKEPSGIAVTDDSIYIADTDNERIMVLDHEYKVKKIFGTPEDKTFDELAFKPLKISVDKTGRIYVIVRDVFEGIIELNSDGSFNRYTGVNPISMNVIEAIWRRFYTEEQLKQMKLYLPTSFTNMIIDDLGFIYATSKADSSGNDQNMIKKINTKGIDVLKRNGYDVPKGDLTYIQVKTGNLQKGPSELVDIAINDIGMYTVLDQKRGRLFTYDNEGRLLYISADKGDQEGKLGNPVAVTYFNGDLVVLDQDNKSLEVYGLTEFGELINEAIKYHYEGDFEKAAEVWTEVAKLNTNYEIAYVGIGKSLLRQGKYKEALENFKLGKDKYYYGKAYEGYRKEFLNNNFSIIMTVTTIVILYLFRKPLIDIFKKDREDEE
ncbi:hypothetical protein KHQ81_02005 [Mycoplasmatota bacterium]|nr:hypothetical protein KHQ81_02005 [Mycoplasmatota bacterium]